MSKAAAQSKYKYSREELENLSNNILKKMVLLNTTLPDLAKAIGMEYQTLWRIAYKKDNYMPNLRVLFPLADFFNVTVADLLKNPNIPQYVPIISIKDVYEYLAPESTANIDEYKKILCNEYIHERAFALEIKSNYLEKITPIKYIFKPFCKIIIDGHILFRYENRHDLFFKINNISNEFISGTNVYNNEPSQFKINKTEALALAVKQIMDNDLI